MKLNAGDLALIRTRPQETRLWLSIFEPQTVLACQINDGSIAKGARTIPFNNVTEGSYLLVESGMTMYIGTSPGGRDVGRIRVRSATANNDIIVSENSHIEWVDDLYLTIVYFFEIWPMYTRLVQNGETVTFYKDWDIVYTNQNSVLGSFVNMGCHYAGFLEDDDKVDVYYSASGTLNLRGLGMTYQWHFEGGTPTGSSAQTPGNIMYDTPGFYTTKLAVSFAGGGLDVSYRHVSIYDRPEDGVNVPILKWEMGDISGSRAQGGHKVNVTVHEDVSSVVDGALVVIFADDWYGGTKQSLGGNALGRPTIVFNGYIMDGSIVHDYQHSSVSFDVGSPSEIMKISEGFSVSVESRTANETSTWYQLREMDVRRAMYHYLRWHSTVLYTNDFEFVGTDQNIQYFDSDRGSIYNAINTVMRGALVGEVVCDRQGKIWAEVDIGATDGAVTGSFADVMTVRREDWIGQPDIVERINAPLSFLEMGGIAYAGPVAATFQAFMTSAPGSAPRFRGKVERRQGLALASQAQLNTLAGNIFAHRNARYPNISLRLASNFRNLDIAPQEVVNLIVFPDDTERGISFIGDRFHIEGMSLGYDETTGLMLPTIDIHGVTQGIAGDSIIIPDVPPTEGYDQPPLELPALPVLAFPPFNFAGETDGGSFLIGHAFDNGVGFTTQTSWTKVTFSGLTGYNAGSMTFGGTNIRPALTTIYVVTLQVKFTSDPGEAWAAITPNDQVADPFYTHQIVSRVSLDEGSGIYWVHGSGMFPLIQDTAYNLRMKTTNSVTAWARIAVASILPPVITGIDMSVN